MASARARARAREGGVEEAAVVSLRARETADLPPDANHQHVCLLELPQLLAHQVLLVLLVDKDLEVRLPSFKNDLDIEDELL